MSGDSNPGMSKWMWAMLLGFPAVGFAYYYISKTGTSENKKKGKEKNSAPGKTVETKAPYVESEEADVPLSPLEQSLRLKEHGNQFYRESKYKEAVKCYTEAIGLCPSDEKEKLSALYQNRAAAYEALGNLEEVVLNCTEAIKMKPNYLKAMSRRYKACKELGQLRQALEDVTACCHLQGFSNERDIMAADDILKKYGVQQTEIYMKNKPVVMPSQQFFNQFLNSQANDPIKNLMNDTTDSDNDLQGIRKAKNALKKGDYDAVMKGCDEEINLVKETSQVPSRNYYEALLLRGTLNMILNEAVRSKADLDTIIDNGDVDRDLVSSALLKRATIHIALESLEKAHEDFDRAEKVFPENSDVYHQKAQILLLSDRPEEAVVEFEKAEKLSPDFSVIQVQKYFTQYKIAMSKEDNRKALVAKNALKKLINNNPTVVEGSLLLSQIYNELKEFDESERIMNEAINADPTNATILVHRGLLYLQWKGDIESAVKDMKKAIEIDPKCGFAYETLASVEVQRGNLANAVVLFEKALPLAKSFKEAIHIMSLKLAAQTQNSVASYLGLMKM